MKTYVRLEVQFHAFVTSALEAGECSASRQDCFTRREKKPELFG
jgi:hypothetical protein